MNHIGKSDIRGLSRYPTGAMASRAGGPHPIWRPIQPAARGKSSRGWRLAMVSLLLVGSGFVADANAAGDPAPLISLEPQTRAPQIAILGPAETALRLEFTENLAPPLTWQLLSNVTLSASSALVVDRSAAGKGMRFYRTARSVSSSDTNLLLWLKFDDNLRGEGGETPLSQQGATFRAGKAEQSVYLGATGYLRYAITNNLDPREGTIEFWLQSDWDGSQNEVHVFFEAGDNFNNGMLLSIDSLGNLRFLQWGDDPATPAVENNIERGLGFGGQSWVMGYWYHLAAAWKNSTREMAFYLNGEVMRTATNGVTIPAFSTTYLEVGAETDNTRSAMAALDDFRIYNRMRTAEQIKRDYQNPGTTMGSPP